jgi:hypothetical protein
MPLDIAADHGWPDLWGWVQQSGYRSRGVPRLERQVGGGFRFVQPVELATDD